MVSTGQRRDENYCIFLLTSGMIIGMDMIMHNRNTQAAPPNRSTAV